MYHILLPVDTNETRARSQAAFVSTLPAAADSIHVTVLFVFAGAHTDDLPREFKPFEGSPHRIGAVMRAVEHLESAQISVEIMEESTDAADQIHAIAEELTVDLIVLGGRKRSLPEKALFGSVTEEVIRESNVPVVITGTTGIDESG